MIMFNKLKNITKKYIFCSANIENTTNTPWGCGITLRNQNIKDHNIYLSILIDLIINASNKKFKIRIKQISFE